jgi:tripartite-type tricarboxylate transporter receptor subunit TctC
LAGQGVSGFNGEPWLALRGPAGLPVDIVRKYAGKLPSVLAEPELRDMFSKQGSAVTTGTPEELGRQLRVEFDALAKLVKDANIKGSWTRCKAGHQTAPAVPHLL